MYIVNMMVYTGTGQNNIIVKTCQRFFFIELIYEILNSSELKIIYRTLGLLKQKKTNGN